MVNHFARKGTALMSTLLAVTLIAIAAPAASAASGPIGVWRLKGDFKNARSTNVKMVSLGATKFNRTSVKGTIKKALLFDEGEGLRISKIPKPGRKSYTMDILFKLNDIDGFRRIMSFGPNNVDKGLYFQDGRLSLFPKVQTAVTVVGANQWVRLRVTRVGSSGQMKFYVNGKLKLKFKDKANRFKLREGKIVLFQDDGNVFESSSGTASTIKLWKRVVAP